MLNFNCNPWSFFSLLQVVSASSEDSTFSSSDVMSLLQTSLKWSPRDLFLNLPVWQCTWHIQQLQHRWIKAKWSVIWMPVRNSVLLIRPVYLVFRFHLMLRRLKELKSNFCLEYRPQRGRTGFCKYVNRHR